MCKNRDAIAFFGDSITKTIALVITMIFLTK